MTVVINEFEVVPEAEPAAAAASEAPPPTTISAPEVERMVVHLLERAARVWAH